MTDQPPLHDPAELTRYIETRYHARHRDQLPLLAELSAMVEAVHIDDPRAPAGLAAVLDRMIGDMEVHMKKEELILFPAIRNGGGPGIENPIAAMRADHDNHAFELSEIRRITGGPDLPDDACGSWTRLYRGLEEFMDDLQEHIRLENDVLFPQFERETRLEA
ncbi:putative regulator of cell morphogenesis and NO signaling [Dinoroseobacter shibae DFL 12 = DSM 16493]|jgi:regulator of cell morphogenesis and NO signaling|uniref:Putative regulator of cell morphogenesis and NO signaling n=1 Tax=Dinoroseobacter shibae (strain DSM 16493 / NCIMB 14021 / DFL 12) TaxID=398580 RepID=A8LRK9_DINSH|nr:hemerythrin domain-containing protein [Dinoroseobacter shibae]ABV94040.1 putative regulator of cell morphogenesis and NO signaling [Dinoroseobacter shibae DFL 12 = DSM 16493]URF45481.1 hemerythrin domain-containing protein [Dinoroseobacter shibae]URF49786.1 hemerythrin domain-containing protein [Dinoroseobacter shibae]